ncbi:hypothetical protein [uncultured Clostridium sp.]|uniref:hypothetical protein n=1 Tax=uncultured Clostridium sp. TaxID=59620 RepID=UPI0028E2C1CB|nr:hypothetical protein [uncultured Clostridium sp.]
MAEITECRSFACDNNKNGKCTLENVRIVVIENELECEDANEPTQMGITYLDD